jgi:hypothetical protein
MALFSDTHPCTWDDKPLWDAGITPRPASAFIDQSARGGLPARRHARLAEAMLAAYRVPRTAYRALASLHSSMSALSKRSTDQLRI